MPLRAMPSAGAAGLAARPVDHSRLMGACITCHNGRIAAGAPLRHLGASTRCDNCHTTNAWLPARFDHLAMAPRGCASCHDGLRAVGMPRNHIPTSQPCGVCHGTLAWRPVRVEHSGFINGCATCHNNVAAAGLTITHLRTQRDCSECHRYPDWSVIIFRHALGNGPASYPAGTACTACHTANSEQATVPHAAGSPPIPKAAGSPPAMPQRRPVHAPF